MMGRELTPVDCSSVLVYVSCSKLTYRPKSLTAMSSLRACLHADLLFGSKKLGYDNHFLFYLARLDLVESLITIT